MAATTWWYFACSAEILQIENWDSAYWNQILAPTAQNWGNFRKIEWFSAMFLLILCWGHHLKIYSPQININIYWLRFSSTFYIRGLVHLLKVGRLLDFIIHIFFPFFLLFSSRQNISSTRYYIFCSWKNIKWFNISGYFNVASTFLTSELSWPCQNLPQKRTIRYYILNWLYIISYNGYPSRLRGFFPRQNNMNVAVRLIS